MARETAKGVKKPSKQAIETGVPKDADDEAAMEAYTGPDGSKGLGYLKHEPSPDTSGLGSVADDAGRTEQEPGANTGGSPQDPTTAVPDHDGAALPPEK